MLFGCSSSAQTTTLSPGRQSMALATMLRPSVTFFVTAISAGLARMRRAKRSRADAMMRRRSSRAPDPLHWASISSSTAALAAFESGVPEVMLRNVDFVATG